MQIFVFGSWYRVSISIYIPAPLRPHLLVAGLVCDLRLLIGDGFDWIELGRDTLYGMGNVETGPSVDETTNNGMDRMEI